MYCSILSLDHLVAKKMHILNKKRDDKNGCHHNSKRHFRSCWSSLNLPMNIQSDTIAKKSDKAVVKISDEVANQIVERR